MKITKTQLKQIIKEELSATMTNEIFGFGGDKKKENKETLQAMYDLYHSLAELYKAQDPEVRAKFKEEINGFSQELQKLERMIADNKDQKRIEKAFKRLPAHSDYIRKRMSR